MMRDKTRVDQSVVRKGLTAAKNEVSELGGLSAFRTGEWLLKLITTTFKNFSQEAARESLRMNYANQKEQIAERLITEAARESKFAGAVTGAFVSLDEVIALLTGGEGVVGLPANIAVALLAVAGEVLFVTRLQLRLIARLGVLYECPLNSDDPQDILTILAFAFGGGVAELAGNEGMKVGGESPQAAVRQYVRKQVMQSLSRVGKKLGYKLFRRTVMNSTVPLASIYVGARWNQKATKRIGKIAIEHFEKRRHSRSISPTSVQLA